jgi:hypothetical protein
MKIVNTAGILRKQGLQEGVGSLRAHFFADEAQAPGDAVDVDIDRYLHLVAFRGAYKKPALRSKPSNNAQLTTCG